MSSCRWLFNSRLGCSLRLAAVAVIFAWHFVLEPEPGRSQGQWVRLSLSVPASRLELSLLCCSASDKGWRCLA